MNEFHRELLAAIGRAVEDRRTPEQRALIIERIARRASVTDLREFLAVAHGIHPRPLADHGELRALVARVTAY